MSDEQTQSTELIATMMADVGAVIGLFQGYMSFSEMPAELMDTMDNLGMFDYDDPIDGLTSFVQLVNEEYGTLPLMNTLASLVASGILEFNRERFETFYELPEKTPEVQ